MPGLSKVIVLDPDVRAGRQVALGFQREGVAAEVAEVPRDPSELALPADAALVVVGGTDLRALELVRQARRRLDEAKVDAPIVFAGRGVRRTDAEAAGADEVVLQPAYLRDVVTIGRLLHGQPAAQRDHLVGSLVETTGVLTLVRALAALGRSAVLTLIRGLRRGEVRFYHGEVTSAQVGLIHGQAALHQLLLWTDARFDFLHEDVVRRHQIPLERDELFADAERFLSGVRESAGRLSPSMVLEQDAPRIKSLGKQIPMEVHSVLRMFDGHRVLADVLEDSPYRVFETLRVAQLAMEAGLVREATGPRPRATWRAVLAIEEWLVGSETRDDVLERQAGESGPVPRQAADGPSGPVKAGGGGGGKTKGSRRKRKKRRAQTPVGVAAAAAPAPKQDIDWGSLVPRTSAAEVGPLSGVVPASEIAGEITLPPREKLEELTDPSQRDRIFPADEASVVYDEAAERERQRISAERKAQEKAQEKVAQEADELARRLEAARATLVTPPEEMVAAIRGDEAAPRAVEPKQTERMPTVAPAPGEPRPERPAASTAPAGGPRAESAAPEAPSEIKRTLPMQTVAVPPGEAAATAAAATAAATATAAEDAKPTELMAAVPEASSEIKRTLPMQTVAVPPAPAAAEAAPEAAAAPAGDAAPSAAPLPTAAMPTRKMRAAVPFDALEAAATAESTPASKEPAEAAPSSAVAAPSSAEAAPAIVEAAPAIAEAAPATAEAAPATAEAAPSPAEAAPSSVETAPSSTEAASTSVDAAPSATGATPTSVEAAPSSAEAAPSSAEAASATAEAAPSSAESSAAAAVSAPAPAPVDPALAPTEPVATSPSTEPASAEAAPVVPSTAAPTVRIVGHRLEPAEAAPAEAAPAEAEAAPAEAAASETETAPPPETAPPEAAAPTAAATPTTTAPTRPMRAVTPDGMPALTRPGLEPGPEPEPPTDDAGAAPHREAQAMVSGELASPAAAAAAPVAPADDADTVRGKRPSDGLPSISVEVGLPKELPPVIVELDRGATPVATVDEPSDGVIRQTIASAETAPTGRRSPPPGSIPVDDRPEDTTGEIVTRTGRRDAVAPAPDAEPSILVADLAEAHTAVAAVTPEQAAAPAPPTMATPVAERVVTEVSEDAATAFTAVEEDFFRAGADKTAPRPAVHVESFDDLDEGYQPVGFWDRLLGRKPKR